MKFSTLYDFPDTTQFGTVNTEDSMTQESSNDDTDINVIMKRYGQTGQVPGVLQEGIYGDFTQVQDYRTALELVRQADTAFAEVPAEVRNEFDNDPQRFIDFANDEKNIEQMRKWGLAKPEEKKETPVAPAPTPVVITPAPTPAPPQGTTNP